MESYKIKFSHGKIININTTYEKSRNYSIIIYPALENFLFGPVTLTKHADINQYKYCGYEIGFDRKGTFSFGNGFGVAMISSTTNDNRKKDILILGKDAHKN